MAAKKKAPARNRIVTVSKEEKASRASLVRSAQLGVAQNAQRVSTASRGAYSGVNVRQAGSSLAAYDMARYADTTAYAPYTPAGGGGGTSAGGGTQQQQRKGKETAEQKRQRKGKAAAKKALTAAQKVRAQAAAAKAKAAAAALAARKQYTQPPKPKVQPPKPKIPAGSTHRR